MVGKYFFYIIIKYNIIPGIPQTLKHQKIISLKLNVLSGIRNLKLVMLRYKHLCNYYQILRMGGGSP